jgi:uncharacterized protein YuzE
MKVMYDSKHDILRIRFSEARIEESEESAPGFIFDYSADGKVVGLEILDASESTENPRLVEYAEVAA